MRHAGIHATVLGRGTGLWHSMLHTGEGSYI
jgi:hypothetical protein